MMFLFPPYHEEMWIGDYEFIPIIQFYEGNILAKTGSMSGVRALAGYLKTQTRRNVSFYDSCE